MAAVATAAQIRERIDQAVKAHRAVHRAVEEHASKHYAARLRERQAQELAAKQQTGGK